MTRLALLLPLLLLPALFAAGPPRTERFSLDRRVPLTTSRVVGSPEPPPPFRTRRFFEKHTFRNPVYLISHPAHAGVFVVEQNGKIVHVPTQAGKLTEFCKLADADTYGMTFHPDYRKNRLVYVFANGPNSKPKKRNQILCFTTAGDPPKCDPASRKLIIEWESNGHNGGDLGFGPDGMLYITSGDGTSDSDGDVTGQDLRDLCSGVLRIDVDHPDEGKGYAIPKDNPFLATKGARGELWAFGLRNPWRMTFDTGDLYVGDVGQDWIEMIHLIKKGGNYGWSVMEGSRPFQPLRQKGPGPILPPLIEHPHSESRSITGGLVYRGEKFPELKGVYIYGDYSTGKVWGLKQKGGKVTWKRELAWTRLQIVGFGTDAAGEVYLVDYANQIHALERAPAAKVDNQFPRRLSETGLFESVAEHRPQPGLIPYSVNSPLWSDGADKQRFLALPGTEPITFSEHGAWKFPELTVLVKTFSIETPQGRRRIETRLLTLQQGEWVGYSYAWNDAQDDADLVESGGRDAAFVTADRQKLPWRYPSRVECMVCHTRAADYVLGLTTAQMNREHDYGGVRMNQLEALQRLEVLRVPREHHLQVRDEERGDVDLLAQLTAPLGTRKPGESRTPAPAVKSKHRPREGHVSYLARRIEDYPRLADPADEKADLDERARSYLHANCAHCHVWAGGGNSAIQLDVRSPLAKTRLIDETPLHDRYGIAEAKLVAPGSPERSVLTHRLKVRGKGQMPPLASTRVDEKATGLIRAWIRAMK